MSRFLEARPRERNHQSFFRTNGTEHFFQESIISSHATKQMPIRLKGVTLGYLSRCQHPNVTTKRILSPNATRNRGSCNTVAVLDFLRDSRNSCCPQTSSTVATFLWYPPQRRGFLKPRWLTTSARKEPLPSAARSGKDTNLPLRSYQEKAKNFLEQVKARRVQSKLVTQKIEEILILSLSEYDSNTPSDGPLALELLETALRYTKQSLSEQNIGERLLPRLFSLSCQLMLRSGHTSAFNDVHYLLVRLLDGHKNFLVQNDYLYNTHHVNDACSYYIRHIVMDANQQKRKLDNQKSRQLYQLIERLKELHRDPLVPLVANPYIDDSLILLLCNQHKVREAHELLRGRVKKSIAASQNCRELEVPLVSSFTTIINGYARTSEPDKARNVIKWMMSFQEKLHSSSHRSPRVGGKIASVPPPNLNCFNGLLHAYAMAGAKNAGFKAEQTLTWMEEICESMDLDIRPNDTTYNICINAWARSKHPDAPIRAENLLRQLVDLGESGRQIEPSEEAFTTVMNAWVNSIDSSGCSKRLKRATDRVNGIINLMERISENSHRLSLSVVPYTVLMKSWEIRAQKLDGTGKQKCGDEILKVLERMRARGVPPTTEVYNSILTTLAQISPMSAVFYFLELEQLYRNGIINMDTRTFNCGLNAIAVLNRPDAVGRATDILKRMFEYHESDPSILPSTLTFNIILKVLSRSTSHTPESAAKAQNLLSEMDAMPSVTPDFISYVTCILAWGRSHEKDKIERVVNLLHRFISTMKDQQGRNDKSSISVFNAVFSVCHHNLTPEYREEAVRASRLAMSELRRTKGLNPDQKTYESFFKVMKEATQEVVSSSSSFTNQIETEFNKCIDDGYVTRDILSAFHSVVPRNVFEKLVGQKADPATFSIPKQWCKSSIPSSNE